MARGSQPHRSRTSRTVPWRSPLSTRLRPEITQLQEARVHPLCLEVARLNEARDVFVLLSRHRGVMQCCAWIWRCCYLAHDGEQPVLPWHPCISLLLTCCCSHALGNLSSKCIICCPALHVRTKSRMKHGEKHEKRRQHMESSERCQEQNVPHLWRVGAATLRS